MNLPYLVIWDICDIFEDLLCVVVGWASHLVFFAKETICRVSDDRQCVEGVSDEAET